MAIKTPLRVTRPWPAALNLALECGLELLTELPSEVNGDLLKLLPADFARRHRLVIVGERAPDILLAALEDPLDLAAIEEARWFLQRPLRTLIAPKEVLDELLRSAEAALAEMGAQGTGGCTPLVTAGTIQDELSPPARFLNSLIAEAVNQGASDVHLLLAHQRSEVRYRIDGALLPRAAPMGELCEQLFARIKLLAHLNIAERQRPQDGRFSALVAGRQIDIRVGALPIFAGEKIALRLLDPLRVPTGLAALQIPPGPLKALRRQLRAPQGLVLVCGPTGSGKTTTLHAALRELSSERKNLVSVEDPVEIALPGIAQVPVRRDLDLDFGRCLRHILRQDPDVLFIGEIRDSETAKIALRAALTGHLVLSTMHTPTALAAVERLLELGVDPFGLATSLAGVLAQRLVRVLCPRCKRPRRDFAAPGSCEPKGCAICYETGYQGRCALFEWLCITEQLRGEIAQCLEGALPAAMASLEGLRAHGLDLVRAGTTSWEELQAALTG